MKRRSDLTSPRHRYRFDVSYDAEAFGQFSESIARYLGTARFLVWQTVVVVLWLAFNLLPPERYQFDPWDRGLVLLTLVLSLQASYAAPLILLAQNRQERRDRVGLRLRPPGRRAHPGRHRVPRPRDRRRSTGAVRRRDG